MIKKRFIIKREATGVFIWSIIACIVRIILLVLVTLSMLNNKDESDIQGNNFCIAKEGEDGGRCSWMISQIKSLSQENVVFKEFMNILSVLSSWVLAFFPTKVKTLNAPGFIFASTWVLYPIRDFFGFIPNLPCRICETIMGRLSVRELAIIFPIHFLIPTAAFWLLQHITTIDPIIYSERHVIDSFLREILITTLFTIGLLVIPELLRINGIRRGYALLILYPLYSFSVDSIDGVASVFGPNTIYSLRWIRLHEEVPLTQFPHLIGPILGGIFAGKVMNAAFPDD